MRNYFIHQMESGKWESFESFCVVRIFVRLGKARMIAFVLKESEDSDEEWLAGWLVAWLTDDRRRRVCRIWMEWNVWLWWMKALVNILVSISYRHAVIMNLSTACNSWNCLKCGWDRGWVAKERLPLAKADAIVVNNNLLNFP